MSSSTKSPVSMTSTPESNYLQLPKIDLRPERYHYPWKNEITYRDETTSARSSSLNNVSRLDEHQIIVATGSASIKEQQRSRSRLERFNKNELKNYHECLENVSRNVIGSEEAFRKAFLNPADVEQEVAIDQLKKRDALRRKSLNLKTKKKSYSKAEKKI